MNAPSSGFMAARHEPRTSLDDFPTPPWATRALCERLHLAPGWACREPAANRGHMVAPLREYFGRVEASDIHDYGAGFAVRDYLDGPEPGWVQWTVTNPPFLLAEAFIDRALKTSTEGVAMLVRLAFLEGIGRHARLFTANPPDRILQFTERVVIHRVALSEKGSTAAAYCWLVWEGGCTRGPRFEWIAPCRKRLERPGDYEVKP